MRRRGMVAIGVSIAAVAGVRAAPDEVAANDDGIMIALDEASRFEFAVAGTVQFQDDEPSPVRPTIPASVIAQGVTVDLATTSVGTTTSPSAGSTTQPTSGPAVIIRNSQSNAGSRGLAALQAIDYPWQDALSGWTISFEPGRSDISGLVDFQQRRISIYVRSSHTDAKLEHVIAHELGHVVDWRFVTNAERTEWIDARGLGNRSWYPSSGSFDFSSPAGDFAEAFAVAHVGGPSYSQIGGPFSAADLALARQISGR